MAIPRNIGEGLGSTPSRKPSPIGDPEVFNPILDDEEDDSLPLPAINEFDDDDAFDDDVLPPIAGVIPKVVIDNLDDEDLDAILGINDEDLLVQPEEENTSNQQALEADIDNYDFVEFDEQDVSSNDNYVESSNSPEALEIFDATDENSISFDDIEFSNDSGLDFEIATENNSSNSEILSDEDSIIDNEIEFLSNDDYDIDVLISSLDDEQDYSGVEELIKKGRSNSQEREPEERTIIFSDDESLDLDEALSEIEENRSNEVSFDDSEIEFFSSDSFDEDFKRVGLVDKEEEDNNFSYDDDEFIDTSSTDVDFDNLISFDDSNSSYDHHNSSDSDNDNASDEEWSFDDVVPNDSEYPEGYIDDAFSPIEDEDNTDDWSVSDEEISQLNSDPLEAHETPLNNQDAPKKQSSKKGFLNGLRERLAGIKEQVLADARGEEIPASSKSSRKAQDEDELEDDDTQEEQDIPRGSKKNSGRGKKKQGFISKAYNLVVNFFFGILTSILGILSKLPLIGKFFKPILAATKILKAIASIMPIVFIVLIMGLSYYFSVPSSFSAEFPDEGSATFSSFEFKDNKASGVITNTGEVILDEISPTFKIYSIKPSLNPLSWFTAKEVGSCKAKPATVDIDNSEKVSATCKNIDGLLPRASGVLQ